MLNIPELDKLQVFRIVVALGIHNACKKYFGGESLGSLMMDSGLHGDDHEDKPFVIGHVNLGKVFVHVFDDFNLDVILNELDTIYDFVNYLSKKEELLSRESPIFSVAGEEQLLAQYMKNIGEDGKHDFGLKLDGVDALWLGEGGWEKLSEDPQYKAKKKADEISYSWDKLIEHFIKNAVLNPDGDDTALEQTLRVMAEEGRVSRRMLARALAGVVRSKEGLARLIISNDNTELVYLFLSLMHPDDIVSFPYRQTPYK